jgi:hypothetical protein
MAKSKENIFYFGAPAIVAPSQNCFFPQQKRKKKKVLSP